MGNSGRSTSVVLREVGKQVRKNGFNYTEREKEYVQMKECPRHESFADGNVGDRSED